MLFISSPRRDPSLQPCSPSPCPAGTPGIHAGSGEGEGSLGHPQLSFLGAALRVGRVRKHPEQAVGQWEGFSLSMVGVPGPAIPEDGSWDRIVPLGFCLEMCSAPLAWIRESCWASAALINGMLLLPLPPTHFHFHFTCGTQPCHSQPGHK